MSSIVFAECGRCFFQGRDFHTDNECEEHSDSTTAKCDCCGRVENIDLIDSKPSDGDWEGGDYDRFECIACYGPGWMPAVDEALERSICPEISHRYVEYATRGIVWC